MNYGEEHWIKVYTRDTPGWVSLSWQARGLMLELARKLPKHSGELPVGKKGLAAIAPLLRATWSEIEPFIRELIENGTLEYDAERQTISDPQHVERQNAVASAAERKRRQREREAECSERGHAMSRDVTSSHDDVTDGHVESLREEKRREEKEERESARDAPPAPAPLSGVIPKTEEPRGQRALRPDEPLTDQRRKDFDALTFNVPAREIDPEWRNFVDDRIAKTILFASAAAVDADWRKWVRRQNGMESKARVAGHGRRPADPPRPERPMFKNPGLDR